MGIITDLATQLGELRDAAQGAIRRGAKSLNLDKPDEFRSVARKARKSIVYYPVILTDALPTELLGPVMHYVQARAAIYTRIAITNEDPTNEVDGKEKMIMRFSGQDLSVSSNSTLLGQVDDNQVGDFIEERIKAEDFDFFAPLPQNMESLLAPAIHSPVFEANGNKGGGNRGGGGNRADRDGGRTDRGLVSVQDQNIDKMIGLMPTVLQIKVAVKGSEGKEQMINIVLAVKAVAHPVPSMDLRNALQDAVIENSFILQVLRLTSGEITFIKDFVLNLKQIRKQFTPSREAASKIMATLRRQSGTVSKMNVLNYVRNDVVPPTATIVVLSEEVDELMYRTNINLAKPSTIKDLLSKHHFMSFVIVNESLGVISVFDEGSNTFERITISDLKKLSRVGQKGGQMGVEDLFRLVRGG